MSVSNEGVAAQAMAGGVKGVDSAGNWTRPAPPEGIAPGLDSDAEIDALVASFGSSEQETASGAGSAAETRAEFEDFDDDLVLDDSDDTSTLSDDPSSAQETAAPEADDEDADDDPEATRRAEVQRALRELLGLDDESEDEPQAGTDAESASTETGETQKPDEDLMSLPALARELYDRAKGKSTSLAKSLADSQEYISKLETELAERDEALERSIPAFDEAAFREKLRARVDANEKFSEFSDEEIKEYIDNSVEAAKSRHNAQTESLRSSLSETVKKLRDKQEKEMLARQEADVKTWSDLSSITGGNDMMTLIAFNEHKSNKLPLKQAALKARDQFESAVLNHVKSSASFGKAFTDGLMAWVRESDSGLAKSLLASAARSVFRRAPSSVSPATPPAGASSAASRTSPATASRKPTPKAAVSRGKVAGVATPSDLAAEMERMENLLTRQLTARNNKRGARG